MNHFSDVSRAASLIVVMFSLKQVDNRKSVWNVRR
jgi:hypothetical protein